jgi:hypothetical protein
MCHSVTARSISRSIFSARLFIAIYAAAGRDRTPSGRE